MLSNFKRSEVSNLLQTYPDCVFRDSCFYLCLGSLPFGLVSLKMMSKFKLYEALTHLGERRTVNMCNWATRKCFCNMVESPESPELPNWVKYPSDGNSSIRDEIDDFVLPNIGNFVSSQKVQKGIDIKISHVSSKVFDDGNVEEICMIIKGSCTSPEAVVETLSGRNFEVSKSLVYKVLNRFCNHWTPAFGFFKWASMEVGYKHSADSYDLMVDILGRAKQFRIMWELVDGMVRLGGLMSLTTISKIMRRLVRAGRPLYAIAVFREVERFGLRRDTSVMNLLLDALCKERSVEYAWDAFFEFKNEIQPNVHTFNVLIHGCCKARQLDKAWWTMEEMRKSGFHPCVISYTSLVEAYCSEKDFLKVDTILDEMQSKGCPPNVVTYTIVMHSLGKAKETYEALGVYEKMKKLGCVPDTSFFNSLIYILSKAGRFKDARSVFEEMCTSRIKPDVTTYNTMISTACEHSQANNALKLLQEMEESSCKPNLKTYAPLLKICCRQKWMKILFYLLNDMFRKDISLELGTYSLLVDGLCKSGKLKQACLFFEEMVSKGLVPRLFTYRRLMDELERNNMDKEKERIQHLMEQAESLEQRG